MANGVPGRAGLTVVLPVAMALVTVSVSAIAPPKQELAPIAPIQAPKPETATLDPVATPVVCMP